MLKHSILIVDDEIAILEALSAKFARAGFEVAKAMDGEEGLIVAFQRRPDIILLDVIMPKMDGMGFLYRLRQDLWGRNVPVIIVANVVTPELKAEAFKNNALDFLVKTEWKLEDLVRKVRGQLTSSLQN